MCVDNSRVCVDDGRCVMSLVQGNVFLGDRMDDSVRVSVRA